MIINTFHWFITWPTPTGFQLLKLKDIIVRYLEETLAKYIIDVLQKTS